MKIYFDGSHQHYIGIPHTEKPKRERPKRIEELVTVIEEEKEETGEIEASDTTFAETPEEAEISPENIAVIEEESEVESGEKQVETPVKTPKKATRKEIFNGFYEESKKLKKAKRKAFIMEKMRPYFKYEELLEQFVDNNLERIQRNIICRRKRMVRKVNLQEFNYFCTFTYDDKKHTEQSFREKLSRCLSNFSNRKGWKYVGVWERSPKKQRLHFHGLFYVPEGTLPTTMIIEEGYDFNAHKRRKIKQCGFFLEKFGRNDFEDIDHPMLKSEGMRYIMKYMEKSGEKIVYSRGLPQYFVSDIWEEDIACPYNEEETKFLLFDNFGCWDEGVYIGQVSPEVIEQMPKSNV